MFHHRVLAASRNHHEGENSRRERDHLDRLHNILACDHENICMDINFSWRETVVCHVLLIWVLHRSSYCFEVKECLKQLTTISSTSWSWTRCYRCRLASQQQLLPRAAPSRPHLCSSPAWCHTCLEIFKEKSSSWVKSF